MALDKKLKKDMMHGVGNDTSSTSEETMFPNPVLPSDNEAERDQKESFFGSMPPMPSFVRGEDQEQPVSSENKGSLTDLTNALSEVQKQIESLNQTVENIGQQMLGQDQNIRENIAAMCECIQSRLDTKENTASISTEQLKALEMLLQAVAEKQDRNDRQIAQTLRENANFQIQVRQGMQHDLDELKAQCNGEQFNPILKEIATMYVEYHSLLEEDLEPRVSKNLMSMFEQMADLLADYEAEVCRTPVGETRQTRVCKVLKKIPTGDKHLHNTVANSRKPGVVRGRTVLYPEFVDVYVYDPSIDPSVQKEEGEAEHPTDENRISHTVPEGPSSEQAQTEDC